MRVGVADRHAYTSQAQHADIGLRIAKRQDIGRVERPLPADPG